jgi:hypothetical protein
MCCRLAVRASDNPTQLRQGVQQRPVARINLKARALALEAIATPGIWRGDAHRAWADVFVDQAQHTRRRDLCCRRGERRRRNVCPPWQRARPCGAFLTTATHDSLSVGCKGVISSTETPRGAVARSSKPAAPESASQPARPCCQPLANHTANGAATQRLRQWKQSSNSPNQLSPALRRRRAALPPGPSSPQSRWVTRHTASAASAHSNAFVSTLGHTMIVKL